jgi:serine/threonine protein kinase/class 3 adenylate cyclase
MSNRLLDGKYELQRKVGGGAMGEIWEGFDQNLERKVAIKLMSPSQLNSSTSRARFEREAKAIAKLQSPHVVQVFDAGIDAETPYIVMELLEGEDMETQLERGGRLSLASLEPIVHQISKALMAAYEQGIVHRDFKPANIFFIRDPGAEIRIKILDFGVATMMHGVSLGFVSHRLTSDNETVGTPLYMSPEQIRGNEVDHRSDVWGLAVILYRALTGKHPFEGRLLSAVMVNICTDSPAPPSKLSNDCSPSVDAFFQKALAKDPDKRFQTAHELATAFTTLATAAERKGVKVLVVDDEPHIVKLMKLHFRRQIKQCLYDFVFAQDGEDALDELRRQPDIDVIITDINMPRMDGLTLLSHIGELNPHARTVVASAYGDMTNIRTAMNRGAFDFLVKPIDFNDLAATLEKTVRLTTELRKNARSVEENSILRKFVPPILVDRIASPSLLHSGETWEGTVGFVAVSECSVIPSVSAPEFLRWLNANFEVIVPILTRNGGMIHKFVGSAILAVFRGPDHARRALTASFEARAQLCNLARLTGESSPFGLGISIGVASGDMIAGQIGSQTYERLDFAVLGDIPAIATRLASSAKKNQILMNAATFEFANGAFSGVPVPNLGDAIELRSSLVMPKESSDVDVIGDTVVVPSEN